MSEESKEELKERLTDIQYKVTQLAYTEEAFTGEYNDHFEEGQYNCIVWDKLLFKSDKKYECGWGWPGFFDKDGNVKEKKDTTHGMLRTEVLCGNCNAHLGHVFDDGPEPTGIRYCINSASLFFKSS